MFFLIEAPDAPVLVGGYAAFAGELIERRLADFEVPRRFFKGQPSCHIFGFSINQHHWMVIYNSWRQRVKPLTRFLGLVCGLQNQPWRAGRALPGRNQRHSLVP